MNPKINCIDLGYKKLKYINSEGESGIFDSEIAPYIKHPMEESLKGVVEIITVDGKREKHLYGETALRESNVSGFTRDRDKHHHPAHNVLMFAASRKMDAKPGDVLVVGVPISYRGQKDELKMHLERLHANVSVDGGEEGRVSFGKVIVLTQGIVVFSIIPDLPEGLLISIDGGQKTTDVSTVEHKNGKLTPVPSKCFSLEIGYHQVVEQVRDIFQSETGTPITAVKARELAENGNIRFMGKNINLVEKISKVKENVASAKIEEVKNRLGDSLQFAAGVYLLGGCAEVLPLDKLIPGSKVVEDPQMANARAYLEVAKKIIKSA